eukprot:CAMPEP_0170073030 /NCGR_PEP_ID=MMETSP0019_2-20121128/10520_1 /TAXON_ID=98059 /ORGANISM="Dinobryon sp., Strain UTEXLB2267" /LENGTH=91 /DNA_ID=CAMNT_0010282297 /DNA_START=68 /DNA_END=344 /DNA_ORIENTATION=-
MTNVSGLKQKLQNSPDCHQYIKKEATRSINITGPSGSFSWREAADFTEVDMGQSRVTVSAESDDADITLLMYTYVAVSKLARQGDSDDKVK